MGILDLTITCIIRHIFRPSLDPKILSIDYVYGLKCAFISFISREHVSVFIFRAKVLFHDTTGKFLCFFQPIFPDSIKSNLGRR